MIDYSKWTAQRLFDKVSYHLFCQNAKAYDKKDKRCICYDEKTGFRCAYGCLFSKKDYVDENHLKHGTNPLLRIRCMLIDDDKGIIMEEMQACHDDLKPSRWARHLRAIARQYGLVIPEFLRKETCGR